MNILCISYCLRRVCFFLRPLESLCKPVPTRQLFFESTCIAFHFLSAGDQYSYWYLQITLRYDQIIAIWYRVFVQLLQGFQRIYPFCVLMGKLFIHIIFYITMSTYVLIKNSQCSYWELLIWTIAQIILYILFIGNNQITDVRESHH